MILGDLTAEATFRERISQQDGYGNEQSAWGPVMFTRLCHVLFLRGSEAVLASRLEGRQPVIITVPSDHQTLSITPDMRCEVAGSSYNIRERPRPEKNRLLLSFMAESGVADG